MRTSINVLGDAYGCGVVEHLSRAELKHLDDEAELKHLDDEAKLKHLHDEAELELELMIAKYDC